MPYLSKILGYIPLFLLFTISPWIFNPYEKWMFELPKARLIYIGIALSIISALWITKKIHSSKIMLITLCYLVLLGITGVILSTTPEQSFWGTYTRQMGYIAYLHLFIFPFFLAEIIEKYGSRIIYKMIAWGSFGTSILALSQYSSHSPFAPVETYGFRLYGSFGEPNLLGYYLVLTLFPLWQLFKEATWKNTAKYFYLATLLLSSWTIIDTGSRGAMTALIASIFVVLMNDSKTLWQKYGWQTLTISLTMLISVTGIIVHQLPDKHSFINLRILNNVTVAIRGEIWKTTLAAANQNWLVGHGLEALSPLFEHKTPELQKLLHDPHETIDRAHNDALDHYFSGGIFALIAYLILIGGAFWYSFKLWKTKNILIPFGIVLQFFIISSLGPVHSTHILFLALALTSLHIDQKQKPLAINLMIRIVITILCLVLIGMDIGTIVKDWN